LRAADYLDAVRQLPIATLRYLTDGLPFVVLSPHPDDESLGAGGLIAAACSAGQRVDVVLVTDGSASHPHSQQYPRERLIALRRSEIGAAVTLLGLSPHHVRHLGLPDAKAPTAGRVFDAAVAAIAEACITASAKSLFVTWDGDPHCDHVATARMAEAVQGRLPQLKLWAYPIWGWHLEPSMQLDRDPPCGVRFEIIAQQHSKRAAIAAHVSQMTDLIDDDPNGFRFTEATLAPFLGSFEYFIEVLP
jgi:LmbE family N-acetylglucosaminyl deacetylase